MHITSPSSGWWINIHNHFSLKDKQSDPLITTHLNTEIPIQAQPSNGNTKWQPIEGWLLLKHLHSKSSHKPSGVRKRDQGASPKPVTRFHGA